jgi:hypothetical protein
MPSCAPRPVPTSSAVGVARPERAGAGDDEHRDATVTALAVEAPGAEHQPRPATDSASTTGTNTAATRSASRCTGALPVCAR